MCKHLGWLLLRVVLIVKYGIPANIDLQDTDVADDQIGVVLSGTAPGKSDAVTENDTFIITTTASKKSQNSGESFRSLANLTPMASYNGIKALAQASSVNSSSALKWLIYISAQSTCS